MHVTFFSQDFFVSANFLIVENSVCNRFALFTQRFSGYRSPSSVQSLINIRITLKNPKTRLYRMSTVTLLILPEYSDTLCPFPTNIAINTFYTENPHSSLTINTTCIYCIQTVYTWALLSVCEITVTTNKGLQCILSKL